MARPTKLTPALRERIAAAVSGGSSYHAAAMSAGVADSTLRAWLARGRAEQSTPRTARRTQRATKLRARREAPYVELLESVERAAGRAEVRAAVLITRAAETDWRAAAWWLARRDPETFGERLALEHTGEGGGPVELAGLGVDLSRCSDAELKILQKVASRDER